MSITPSGERIDGPPERIATRLVAQLTDELWQDKDARSAMQVYQMANWIIVQLRDVRHVAFSLAEQDIARRRQDRPDLEIQG